MMTATLADGSTIVSRVKGDPEPAVCGVCRRYAGTGFGWAGRQGRPVLWLCSDPTCGRLAREVYEMPTSELNSFEQMARDEAGEMAGAYLDGIGKTDLAQLTQEEWKTFLHQVIVGFEYHMRELILKHKPPF